MNLKCPKNIWQFALCSIQTTFHGSTLHRLTCTQGCAGLFPSCCLRVLEVSQSPGQGTSSLQGHTERQTSVRAHTCRQSRVASQTRQHARVWTAGGHTNYSSTLTFIIEPIAVSFRKTSEAHLLSTFDLFVFRNPSFSCLILCWRQRRKTRDRAWTHRIDSPLNSSRLGGLVLTVQRNVLIGTQLRKSVQGFCCYCVRFWPAQFCSISATRPEFWLLLNTDFAGRTRRLTLIVILDF